MTPANAEYLPTLFEDAVLGHIFANRLFPQSAPLVLLILGPPGIGKSFQLRAVCQRYNIHCQETSGATYQGNEGAPVRKLRENYLQAAAVLDVGAAQRRAGSVVAIDDFHLSLASALTDNVSQNTQIFMSALMSLCDDPNGFLGEEAGSLPRIPIVATANSTADIYPPLLRNGRARVFEWRPGPGDIREIALSHMSLFNRRVAEEIARRYRSEMPAFFRELAARVLQITLVRRLRDSLDLNRKAELDARDVEADVAGMSLRDVALIAEEILRDEALKAKEMDMRGGGY